MPTQRWLGVITVLATEEAERHVKTPSQHAIAPTHHHRLVRRNLRFSSVPVHPAAVLLDSAVVLNHPRTFFIQFAQDGRPGASPKRRVDFLPPVQPPR